MRDAAIYRQQLISEIESAEKIVLIEHSHESDFRGVDSYRTVEVPYLEYRSSTVTPERKIRFLETARRMEQLPADSLVACAFIPHHTIRFYKFGKVTSNLKVCMACGVVKWDATNLDPPADIFPRLVDFLSGEGYPDEENMDWKLRAEAAVANDSLPPTRIPIQPQTMQLPEKSLHPIPIN